MKKNDIFTFTAPNGVEVTAVVLDIMKANITDEYLFTKYLCYAQNRLFSYYITRRTVPVAIGKDEFGDDEFDLQEVYESQYGEIIVDYAILPDYDALMSASYPQWEQNLEEEIQGMNDR